MAHVRASKPILLVGGVPGESAKDVLECCGKGLGELPLGFPDGETGIRRSYVTYCAVRTFDHHPDLVTLRRPKKMPGLPDWEPKSVDDFWLFEVKPGIDKIHIGSMGYAEEALASYREFTALKSKGIIPKDARFQVSIPIPEDCVRGWVGSERDYKIVHAAVSEALPRDVATICATIPLAELVLQWDVAWGMLAIATDDGIIDALGWKWRIPGGKPLERYLKEVTALLDTVPADAIAGVHLCYGDFKHRHFVQPQDLGKCVETMNATVRHAHRKPDYFHVPVPRDRSDDAYFAPLSKLDIGDTRLYIGLIHYTDGVQGTLKRLAAAKKYARGFGVSTECGWARRPKEQSVDELMRIHCEVAAAL